MCGYTCIQLFFIVLLGANIVQSQNEEPPMVRALRRQVNNFAAGRNAKVTIVYEMQGDFRIRWFRSVKGRKDRLPDAEIQNKLPIRDDDTENYEFSHISSGNVHAITMTIKHLPDDFPLAYTTVFTSEEGSLQYQVETSVSEPTNRDRDYLDGIVWDQIPPASTTFDYLGNLEVNCSAIVRDQDPSVKAELDMYRVFLKPKGRRKYGTLHSYSHGRIHESNEINEESGRYITRGHVQNLYYGRKKYSFSFRIQNASYEEEGAYVCHAQRGTDATYVSSWRKHTSIDSPPMIEFLPCDSSNFDKKRDPFNMTLIKHEETCVLCRSYGYPNATIVIKKDNNVVTDTKERYMDTHINVPEGGVTELTMTLYNTTHRDEGSYSCEASNHNGKAEIRFNIEVIRNLNKKKKKYKKY